jgi:hypothetical protein
VNFLIVAHNWTQSIAVITHTYDEFNNPIVLKYIDGFLGLAWDLKEDTNNPTENSSPLINTLKVYEKKQFSLWMRRYINKYQTVIRIFYLELPTEHLELLK